LGDRLCAIQVKTRQEKGADGGWHMKAKHEKISSELLFYAFLDFGRPLTDPPACFIVPSTVVADVIRRSHATWLATPGKVGQQRKDGEMRRFLPNYDKVGLDIGLSAGWLEPYRENWSQIAGTTESTNSPAT